MTALLILLAAIIVYYVLGWLTILLTYFTYKAVAILSSNNRPEIKEADKPVIFWAWPIVLPITLGSWVLYIPYLSLIKLTPRSPT